MQTRDKSGTVVQFIIDYISGWNNCEHENIHYLSNRSSSKKITRGSVFSKLRVFIRRHNRQSIFPIFCQSKLPLCYLHIRVFKFNNQMLHADCIHKSFLYSCTVKLIRFNLYFKLSQT